VEEVAALTDTQIARIQLPGVRDIREQAKRFLASFDANKAAEQAKRRDEQIEALQDQVKQLIAQQSAPQRLGDIESGETDEPKRGRGRPPKSIMTVAEALEEQQQSGGDAAADEVEAA
jgi:hypothetical protein